LPLRFRSFGCDWCMDLNIMNPGYSGDFSEFNDIALLQLDTRIFEIDPVDLHMDFATPLDNEEVQVFGFGVLEDLIDEWDPRHPDVLQVVTVKVVSGAACVVQYDDQLNLPVDPEIQLCAAAPGKVSISAMSCRGFRVSNYSVSFCSKCTGCLSG
jgi:hypothetical protein